MSEISFFRLDAWIDEIDLSISSIFSEDVWTRGIDWDQNTQAVVIIYVEARGQDLYRTPRKGRKVTEKSQKRCFIALNVVRPL